MYLDPTQVYPIALKDDTHKQDNMIRYQVENNHFSPEIDEGDFVFVDREDIQLTDGLVYLFAHKQKDLQIISTIGYTLENETLKLCTTNTTEIIGKEVLLQSYNCIGRVRKRVAIIEEEF